MVAQELFLQRGLKGVSMKEIAEAVQVTPAALYYHFPDGKSEIFLEVLVRILMEWGQGAYTLIEASHGQPIRERLLGLSSYLGSLPLSEFASLTRNYESEIESKVLNQRKGFLMEQGSYFLEKITSIFAEAQEQGEVVTKVPAHILAMMYEGTVINVQRRRILSPQAFEQIVPESLTEMLVSSFLDGITPHS